MVPPKIPGFNGHCEIHGEKPDFFITVTINLNCLEVTMELKQGQSPYDQTNLLCRTFSMNKMD